MKREEKNKKIMKNLDNKVKKRNTELVMSDVPQNTIYRFLNLASKEDFNSNYGFALKFLMDLYDGILNYGTEHLEQKILTIEQDLEILKSLLNEKEKTSKEKTMMNGNTI